MPYFGPKLRVFCFKVSSTKKGPKAPMGPKEPPRPLQQLEGGVSIAIKLIVAQITQYHINTPF